MDRVNSRSGRLLIHTVLLLFAVYSFVPFLWTALQSLKKLKDASSRTPKFLFTPTLENYEELWLRSRPENPELLAFFVLAALLVLVCLLIFAQYLPWRREWVYGGVALGFVALLWLIPQLLDVARFYDFFINTLIVTVGTIVISISIGCLAGYALARYAGLLGVVVLIAALAFRALPRLAFVLPYYWIGSALNLLDSRLLVDHHARRR